jgi:hypothetical protein
MPGFPSLGNFSTLLFAGCILLAAAGSSAGQKADDEKKPAPEKVDWETAPQRKAPPGADELHRLRIARYNAALEELQARDQELTFGTRSDTGLVLSVGDRLREAALALSNTPAERILVLQQAVDYGKSIERMMDAKMDAGTAKVADCAMARYWRLDAEIRLLEEKGKK